MGHLLTEHAVLKPLENGVQLPFLPDSMWLDIYMSFQESSLMMRKVAGVARKDVTDQRIQNFIPGSDMIEEICGTLETIQDYRNILTRKRATTASTSH